MRHALTLLLTAVALPTHAAAAFDAAAAFGARPSVLNLSLSPDGTKVAYVVPIEGQGSALITTSLEKGSRPVTALVSNGKPEHLTACYWISNDRLICDAYGMVKVNVLGPVPRTRVYAVDSDGKNLQILSTKNTPFTRGILLGGGNFIDLLPDESGAILMVRNYAPRDLSSIGGGTRFTTYVQGVGVDRIDTRTLSVTHVEAANRYASGFLSDGRGNVRIRSSVETVSTAGAAEGSNTGFIIFDYRTPDSREWKRLSKYNTVTREGFYPAAIDHELNVAYGYKKKDGRLALYTVSLDGNAHEELVFARPDVDVDGLIIIGRRRKVVGVSYVTDRAHAYFFAPDIREMLAMLAKALPNAELRVTDSSVDESKLLIYAGSDNDPGVYYIFDRQARKLHTFLVVRDQLEGVTLARQKAVSYPAEDGVMIPAYLTLPPGHEDAKGLPAIVMPHGGPSARDDWGFNWLAQFFANRGFAVLQPEFRGSSGYGDAWFEQNGFRSWKVAIGDVLAGAHWLVRQGTADPDKLAIVGWSYGGYAALQSAVVEPDTFKAVIAIAPVTDLVALKEEYRLFTNYYVASDFIGDGPELHEGSPIEHAASIKAPVLLFHGTADRNVSVEESRRMAEKLKAAGDRCELVTWEDLTHQLDDSSARTEMLRKSDAFLRQALGL